MEKNHKKHFWAHFLGGRTVGKMNKDIDNKKITDRYFVFISVTVLTLLAYHDVGCR